MSQSLPHPSYLTSPIGPTGSIGATDQTKSIRDGWKHGWEDTPKWMFWRPTKRRLLIPPGGNALYEYQHPAFVAREALEEYCAPRNFTGEGSYGVEQAPHRD